MVSMQVAIAAIALSGAGQTVLLDFYTDWCAPCRAMNPTVQALIAAGYPVQRVNKDKDPTLAAKYRIEAIPCFVMLVDGREVDRVVGGTTYSRLERMFKLGAAGPSAAMTAQNAQPSAPLASLNAPTTRPVANSQPPTSPTTAPMSAGISDALLIAATVRLRIEDTNGHSCGSGTIIDARDGKALVLTCGHIFRDSKGKGRIEVDLFGPNGLRQVAGQLLSYDSEVRDIGLVMIDAPGPVATVRVAPPGYRIERGLPVASVGCNNGGPPSVRHSQITSLDKFQGPPNIQVAGQPVEGRSGGGLFSSEGFVIGVCNAADPSDKEGLFAAISSIHGELDRTELSFVYTSPSENRITPRESAGAAAIAAVPLPAMPQQMPDSADLASLGSMPMAGGQQASGLAPAERAALEEIHRRVKEGWEVTIIARPRDNPNARSEVYQLDHASAEFVKQVSAEGSRQNKPYPTSLELPKPRKVLLEWSAVR